MITFNEISKHFQNNFWEKKFLALDNLSFNLEKEQITGFLGANGAGKTTTLKILMKFISQSSGNISYSNDLGSRTEIFKNIGYLPERPYFYPYLTGREFLNYLGQISEVSKTDLKHRIERWSNLLGIEHAIDRKIRGYSKGMLQRLGFISTIIHDPKLIILDEPLSGLDPIGRNEFKKAISGLKKEGKTIFFSSHIVPDVEEICKNIIVLEKGKKIFDGPVQKIIEDNNNDFVEIRFVDKFGELIQQKVEIYERENTISHIVKNDGKIISLTSPRKSLEQIIYEIKDETI